MGEEKLPRGIFLRGTTIWVRFSYKRRKRSESTGIEYRRKSDITHVEQVLGEVKRKIKDGTFIYADYFPNSPALKELGAGYSGKTVEHYLDAYINLCKNKGLEHSSIEGYKRAINPMRGYFSKILARDFSAAHVKNYIQENSNLALKTIRNRMSVLAGAVDEMVVDQVIKVNPVRTIQANTYYEGRKHDEEAKADNPHNEDDENNVDPFGPEEVRAILKAAYRWPPYARMIEFQLNHGLRPSEMAGLQWSHISFPAKKMRIRMARVLDRNKTTKTKGSKRDLELSDRDIELLTAQREYSKAVSPYVWINQAHSPIKPTRFSRGFWAKTLDDAGVRWRPASQMRHTFATRLISQGINLFKLTELMGHTSPKMVFEHYGGYIEAYQQEQEEKDALLEKQEETVQKTHLTVVK